MSDMCCCFWLFLIPGPHVFRMYITKLYINYPSKISKICTKFLEVVVNQSHLLATSASNYKTPVWWPDFHHCSPFFAVQTKVQLSVKSTSGNNSSHKISSYQTVHHYSPDYSKFTEKYIFSIHRKKKLLKIIAASI